MGVGINMIMAYYKYLIPGISVLLIDYTRLTI